MTVIADCSALVTLSDSVTDKAEAQKLQNHLDGKICTLSSEAMIEKNKWLEKR